MKRLFALLLLTAVPVFAQQTDDSSAPRADLCRDPFRQLTNAHWVVSFDLRPLFNWFENRQGNRPLGDWKRITAMTMDPSGHGLLVVNSVDNRVIFLRNYPFFVPKKSTIDVFAVALDEVHTYKDASGVEQTAPVFDYGIPYNPVVEIEAAAKRQASIAK